MAYEYIIAAGTNDGKLFCDECIEKLKIDIASQSVWWDGEELELERWNACCSGCGCFLPLKKDNGNFQNN